MKKIKQTAFFAGVAAIAVAASLAIGAGSARSEETSLAELKKDIAALAAGQQTILQQLAEIRTELNIVKIRCSS